MTPSRWPPDTKWTEVSVATMGCGVSVGPGRNGQETECERLPSRWQLADWVIEPALNKILMRRRSSTDVELPELSVDQLCRGNRGRVVPEDFYTDIRVGRVILGVTGPTDSAVLAGPRKGKQSPRRPASSSSFAVWNGDNVHCRSHHGWFQGLEMCSPWSDGKERVDHSVE